MEMKKIIFVSPVTVHVEHAIMRPLMTALNAISDLS